MVHHECVPIVKQVPQAPMQVQEIPEGLAELVYFDSRVPFIDRRPRAEHSVSEDMVSKWETFVLVPFSICIDLIFNSAKFLDCGYYYVLQLTFTHHACRIRIKAPPLERLWGEDSKVNLGSTQERGKVVHGFVIEDPSSRDQRRR